MPWTPMDMMVLPPKTREKYRNVVLRKALFSVEECGQIRDLAASFPAVDGTITDGKGPAAGYVHDNRRSIIRWLTRNEQTQFVYDRVAAAVTAANEQVFGFALTGFLHALQYTEYDKDGKFDWHMDFGSGPMNCRKISVTVLLSASHEFEGGQFETLTYGQPKAAAIDLGDAIIFPSYIVHRVTPISLGSRRSLVAWIYGPSYV
jgi:PKHD-type hydroxylase